MTGQNAGSRTNAVLVWRHFFSGPIAVVETDQEVTKLRALPSVQVARTGHAAGSAFSASISFSTSRAVRKASTAAGTPQ